MVYLITIWKFVPSLVFISCKLGVIIGALSADPYRTSMDFTALFCAAG